MIRNEYILVQSYVYACLSNCILFYTYEVLEYDSQSVILNFSEGTLGSALAATVLVPESYERETNRGHQLPAGQ